jgi:hypothetical protein
MAGMPSAEVMMPNASVENMNPVTVKRKAEDGELLLLRINIHFSGADHVSR